VYVRVCLCIVMARVRPNSFMEGVYVCVCVCVCAFVFCFCVTQSEIYRVAKTHRIPYLHRSFSAEVTYV